MTPTNSNPSVQHTRGPWTLDRDEGSACEGAACAHIIESDSADAHVAFAFEAADARLIAAAPDLLAACEALVAYDKNGRFGSPNFVEAINAARSAIAKARGGAA